MITAALHGTPIAPAEHAYAQDDPATEMSRIAAEIAERICEMNELRWNAGTDFVLRLAALAQQDVGAFVVVVQVLHGNVAPLLDSYAARGDAAGREKQTIHYRIMREMDVLAASLPAVAAVLNGIRESVAHHEDPKSKADALRDACDGDDAA